MKGQDRKYYFAVKHFKGKKKRERDTAAPRRSTEIMKWRLRRVIAPLLCAHSHCLGTRVRSVQREREFIMIRINRSHYIIISARNNDVCETRKSVARR